MRVPPPDCDPSGAVCIRIAERREDICTALIGLADTHGLPPGFLIRLIWRESGFNPYAISPKGALGIAQFMPGTAALKGLTDPFNPGAALVTSAAYLAELRDRFGSLGMAAAAYNAGEDRVGKYLGRSSGLPDETRAYVQGITGVAAEVWRDTPPAARDWRMDGGTSDHAACVALGVTQTGSYRVAAASLPWTVIIANHDSKAIAQSRLAAATQRAPQLKRVKGEVTRLPGSKTYTALVRQPNQGAARALCEALKQGGVSCRLRAPD